MRCVGWGDAEDKRGVVPSPFFEEASGRGGGEEEVHGVALDALVFLLVLPPSPLGLCQAVQFT